MSAFFLDRGVFLYLERYPHNWKVKFNKEILNFDSISLILHRYFAQEAFLSSIAGNRPYA